MAPYATYTPLGVKWENLHTLILRKKHENLIDYLYNKRE